MLCIHVVHTSLTKLSVTKQWMFDMLCSRRRWRRWQQLFETWRWTLRLFSCRPVTCRQRAANHCTALVAMVQWPTSVPAGQLKPFALHLAVSWSVLDFVCCHCYIRYLLHYLIMLTCKQYKRCTVCLCGPLAQCALSLKCLSAGPGFNPQTRQNKLFHDFWRSCFEINLSDRQEGLTVSSIICDR